LDALQRSGWLLKEPLCLSQVFNLLLGGLLGLLGQENGLYVGQHTTLCDGHSAQELVELLASVIFYAVVCWGSRVKAADRLSA